MEYEMEVLRDLVLFDILMGLQHKVSTKLHILSVSYKVLQLFVPVSFSNFILCCSLFFPLLHPCSICFISSMLSYFCTSCLHLTGSSKFQHKSNLTQQGYSKPPISNQPLSHSLSYLLVYFYVRFLCSRHISRLFVCLCIASQLSLATSLQLSSMRVV